MLSDEQKEHNIRDETVNQYTVLSYQPGNSPSRQGMRERVNIAVVLLTGTTLRAQVITDWHRALFLGAYVDDDLNWEREIVDERVHYDATTFRIWVEHAYPCTLMPDELLPAIGNPEDLLNQLAQRFLVGKSEPV